MEIRYIRCENGGNIDLGSDKETVIHKEIPVIDSIYSISDRLTSSEWSYVLAKSVDNIMDVKFFVSTGRGVDSAEIFQMLKVLPEVLVGRVSCFIY